MKRYQGIRYVEGNTFEINFRAFKGGHRVFKRIVADSQQEASAKRAELIAEARKSEVLGTDKKEKLTFDKIWAAFERNLLSDNLPLKTRLHYKKIYERLFNNFRSLRFPAIQTPSQLNLAFFIEYKEYYVSDLERPKGFRAELIIVKAIMGRLHRMGYCSELVIKALKEIKKPRAVKKEYPEISDTKIKELMYRIKSERPDLHGPIYFMLRTGRRVEETTLIERKDVMWEGINPIRLNIRAETTKTKEFAPLNLLDLELQRFIWQTYQNNKTRKLPYLFLNRQHRKCDQRKISDYLGRLSEEMWKVRITAHYFRHRFCTECGKANIPMVDVMAVCGLKDIGVLTQHYSHSTSAGQAKVLESTRIR